ncbi:MAG: tetratricopeptide repeat protein, partial [Stenotrophomonas maltophilia]
LANSYRAAGQHRQAARLHKKALASRQRTLGADHPSTRASQRNLAATLRASRETENEPSSP